MAVFECPEIILFILIITVLFLRNKIQKKSSLPTNWPLVGMLPGLLKNCHRFHAYSAEVLNECGGTFEFKGPWFCNMNMLGTCDPANIDHIFSRNFSNYPKGPEFRKIFEIFGDGILNADFELWEFHRRTASSFMSDVKFYGLLERAVWHKVKAGLLPVLDYFWEQGIDADLQDIFHRFTFDNICKLVLDYDPCSLCIDLPYIPCENAFNEALEAIFHRHVLPESIWQLQKWLQIGKEKKLMEAWKAFDEFIYPRITSKDDFSFSTAFRKAYESKNWSSSNSRDFIRDNALGLMLAGRDTSSTCLTWLFWLIARNPSTEIKIREEVENELHLKKDKKWRFFNVEESRKLIYLHGALCESLRLFPPVALEHKSPLKPDILPSGNFLQQNTKIIVSFYSVGRMEKVWGEDCLKFMPERWISPSGGIKHVPSYKFPRWLFFQMKMVAATIIYHYNIQLVEGHAVSPRDSVILQAKQGLRVKLSKRNF
ncbi:Cytochrome P450 CYP4/CYP19/CYP26 subfamily [Handroanthus impetiginosus]|uniref:Cytochrome P450 CYP4/CYP19/CYP26 subfamily n=1 Tax=Handroanthus impetiginosus TaxID=429701 RepID=A0A2G9H6F1_9LAMI|nr:Cytochrome P450 CYP4/CYP19/CYP26 subfamily [Handroanthus impetiginosus]